MKLYKFKFENIQLYAYILVSTIILILCFWFYGFLNKNVYKPIATNEVILDVTSIRISDINLTKFKEVSDRIKEKVVSQKVNSRNVFN